MLREQFLLRTKLNVGFIKTEKQFQDIEKSIQRSIERVNCRKQALPKIHYDDALPIAEKREEVKTFIQNHQVIILSGETGSGKTTQIPKICMELGLGCQGYIGHTQPRRIAARTVANRIAEEIGSEIGQSIGYKVRFHDHVHDNSHVKLMTDGILLAEIQNDRYLLDYEVIIIDEAHERSLNIDFLLGYLKSILQRRPELKVIVTSATIDTKTFSRHFSNAPIIEVSGRTYPVEIRYHPVEESDEEEPSLPKAISSAIFELSRVQLGDALVFLPGEREIREVAEYLRKHHPPHTEILPLYARLSVGEQEKIFKPHKGQRVVLATNVAETSLTVPGIKYVIDSGLARVSRYSVRNRIQRLPIEPVSQAAANQRAGRCGRVSAGVCVRLYSEQDFLNRPEFTDPEILRINLASAILQMIALKIGDIERFPFIQAPENKYINDGKKLLFELGAIDANNNLTSVGQQIAQLPVDPRLGKMLVAASSEGSTAELLVIGSFLSVQDPRERPYEMQEKADQAHARFVDNKSDFLGVLKLWEYFNDRSKHLSQNKLRKLCKQEFLSYLRFREWKDIYSQLKNQINSFKFRINAEPASYDAIHRAILSGLMSNVGSRDEDGAFLGCKQKKFYIVPGSGQNARPSKWVMAAEIVETRRNYARYAAKIFPEWIVELGAHLITRSYFEPHWQKKVGQVAAFERISLYGLILVGKQRVNYGPINPQESREVFIREALVEEQLETREKFYQHNNDLIAEIRKLENKSRRPDILIGDEEIYALYAAQIPENIYSAKSLHKWLKENKAKNPQLLYFNEAQLKRESAGFNEALYPDELAFHGYIFRVHYYFDPLSERDGITVTIPLALLNQIKPYWFEWLVPGMLADKVTALIKTLPKGLRKHFVPVPDVAAQFAQSCHPGDNPLLESLIKYLTARKSVQIHLEDFESERIPEYLLAGFELRNSENQIIAHGKDLLMLQRKYEAEAKNDFSSTSTQHQIIEDIKDWDFEIPESVEMKSAQGGYRAFPALEVVGEQINLNYFPNPSQARESMGQALLALVKRKLAGDFSYLKRNLKDIDSQCLLAQKLQSCNELKSELVDLILRHQFKLDETLPATPAEFKTIFDNAKITIMQTANEICQLNHELLGNFHRLQKNIKFMNNPQMLEPLADIQEQLSGLVYRHYLQNTPYEWLKHYPRFLRALEKRLEKLSQDPLSDRKRMLQYKSLWQKYKTLSAEKQQSQNGRMFRWMLEEFRVSLFAQQLKTSTPVSEKRLKEIFASI